MSTKNKKLFGVWMDSHNATIVENGEGENEEFSVLGHVSSEVPDKNSSEKTSNNQEIGLTLKFFKEIASKKIYQ